MEKFILPVEKTVENFATDFNREFKDFVGILVRQNWLWKTLKIGCEKKLKKVKIFSFLPNIC